MIRIEDDYKILLDELDSSVVGFAPDTGHIARGGMDVLKILKTYRPLIKHVHFKDITTSGGWTAMGAGMIDFPSDRDNAEGYGLCRLDHDRGRIA